MFCKGEGVNNVKSQLFSFLEIKFTSKHDNQTFFFRNIIYIIGYKVANVINPSYDATLINNNMATDSPIQSQNATRLIFVYKSDVIGVY